MVLKYRVARKAACASIKVTIRKATPLTLSVTTPVTTEIRNEAATPASNASIGPKPSQ